MCIRDSLLEYLVHPFPGFDEDIGVYHVDNAAVAGPVGVHFVVQAEQDGLAIRLDLLGEVTQLIVAAAAVNIQRGGIAVQLGVVRGGELIGLSLIHICV